MEPLDRIRKLKRLIEANFTYRRFVLVIIVFLVFVLYVGPTILQWLYHSKSDDIGTDQQCLLESLEQFRVDSEDLNANIRHFPNEEGEKPYLPFVGNGLFGVVINPSSPVYIRSGRTLSLPVYWYPVVSVLGETEETSEATVMHYLTGIAHKSQCFPGGVHVAHEFYAHRTFPNIFVQDILVTNPTNELKIFDLQQGTFLNWPTAVSHTVRLARGKETNDYYVVTGMVDVPSPINNVMAVSVISKVIQGRIEVKPQSSVSVQFITVIKYSDILTKTEYATKKDTIEKEALVVLEKVLTNRNLKDDHIYVWKQLWSTGVTISQSKHTQAINGDKINATFYYVLSHVASPYHEDEASKEKKAELMNSLFYAEGCFGGHHTLQADNLWQGLSTIEEINRAVSYWLLTLEKQGCHNLVKAGASGVIQAMVLSIGSLRFSNQHLEFNMHPNQIHRDYLFRRISYGNLTHVNISVEIQDDNKAAMYVALDRSDKYYYACDAGCLDPPVLLGPQKTKFQVKLTEPVTAILYITYDKQHMEDLRHAIHVKNVEDAEPVNRHIIALHRHGHHLGGLPVMFWILIGFGIFMFHAFVFRMIYNELYNKNDKLPQRNRYARLGDANMHRL